MCIVCMMVKAGMSEEATRLAKALFQQMCNQNDVLKLMTDSIPSFRSPELEELIRVGYVLGCEVVDTPKPTEPMTPNDQFEASNVFPINRTKH